MAKINYQESARKIVELVGGRENVDNLVHCITRLRFSLSDRKIAEKNMEEIKKIPGVISVVNTEAQFQVVIGSTVEKMYDAVVEIMGDNSKVAVKKTENKSEEKSGIMNKIMKLISGIMLPVIPAMVACGTVAALFNVLIITKSITQTEGIGMVLYGIGQTCFYFFPVLIGGSAAKYFHMDRYLGSVIGAAMIYPTFITAAGEGTSTKLFGVISLEFQNYSSTIFPTIAAVWLASVLYKSFKKIIPDMVNFVLVPTFTILISVPVSMVVIGPVINTISGLLATAILTVYNFSSVLCGIILGATWILFIVPLGLHWAFMAIFLNNIVTIGYEPIMGLLSGIMGLSGILCAVALKSKNPETRSTAIGMAVSNMFGISEPGLYGIILQHRETMLAGIIGGGISGIIPAVFHTYVFTMTGTAGIFAIPGSINPDGSMGSLIGAVLCNVVGFILCFAITYFQKFDPDLKEKE